MVSTSSYVTSASSYQSRSSMYIGCLIPRGLAEAVSIAIITLEDYCLDQPSASVHKAKKMTKYSQFKSAKLGEVHKKVEDGIVEDGLSQKIKIISPTPDRPTENEAYCKNFCSFNS